MKKGRFFESRWQKQRCPVGESAPPCQNFASGKISVVLCPIHVWQQHTTLKPDGETTLRVEFERAGRSPFAQQKKKKKEDQSQATYPNAGAINTRVRYRKPP
jgi:hypothetical protein